MPSNLSSFSLTSRRIRSDVSIAWVLVAGTALETISVEESQEELEVLVNAGVRRGGHEQEVPGDGAEPAGRACSAWSP